MAQYLPQLTEFAEDVAWHATGVAQGLFDVVTVTVLALAIYATGVEPAPVGRVQAAAVAQLVPVCEVNCITSQVLEPQQDS